MGSDPAELLGKVARHWLWGLAFGLITVLAGIAILFWPRETILILAVIFGVRLILIGIGELVDAFGGVGTASDPRWLAGLMGTLSIVVGIIFVRNVFVTITVIALVVAIYLVVYGIMSAFAAIATRGTPERGWALLSGALSIVAGAALLVYPGLTLLYLAIVLGILLIVVGLIRIAVAVLIRNLAMRLESPSAHLHD